MSLHFESKLWNTNHDFILWGFSALWTGIFSSMRCFQFGRFSFLNSTPKLNSINEGLKITDAVLNVDYSLYYYLTTVRHSLFMRRMSFKYIPLPDQSEPLRQAVWMIPAFLMWKWLPILLWSLKSNSPEMSEAILSWSSANKQVMASDPSSWQHPAPRDCTFIYVNIPFWLLPDCKWELSLHGGAELFVSFQTPSDKHVDKTTLIQFFQKPILTAKQETCICA